MRNTALRQFLQRFLTPEWPSIALVVGLILIFALSGGLFALLVGQAVQVVVEAGSVTGLAAVIVAILWLVRNLTAPNKQIMCQRCVHA